MIADLVSRDAERSAIASEHRSVSATWIEGLSRVDESIRIAAGIAETNRNELASKQDVSADRGFDRVQRTAITFAMPLLIVSLIFVAILISCIFSPVAVPSRRYAMFPLLQVALILELLIVGGAISLMALRFYRFASIGILGTVVIVGMWYFFPVLGAYSLVQLLAALPAFVVLQLRDVRDAFGRN